MVAKYPALFYSVIIRLQITKFSHVGTVKTAGLNITFVAKRETLVSFFCI
jgi:hypothetical protein